MENGKKLIIYVDYDIEQHYENVQQVVTDDDSLSFLFFDKKRGAKGKAQYDMGKILGFAYDI